MPARGETVARTAEAQFAHKQVFSGGGEFALVKLRVDRAALNDGLTFAVEVGDDVVPERFWAGVESGIRSAARHGINGLPIVDVRVALTGGAYHDLDSTEAAFATAAANAFREAIRKAGAKMLW